MGLKNLGHFSNPGVNAWATGKTSMIGQKSDSEGIQRVPLR